MRRFTILALLAVLSACAGFPQLDAVVSDRARAAGYPTIQPLDALLAGVPAAGQDYGIGSLAGRAAALRARARGLRGPVVDAATRARMQAALARRAG